ncbi:MAG: hypothetical protein EHM61_04285, partial [Acidobacteria bacterium]
MKAVCQKSLLVLSVCSSLIVITPCQSDSTSRGLKTPDSVRYAPSALGPQHSQASPQLVRGFGTLPLAFEPNRGQSAKPVKFLAASGEVALFLTPHEVVWTLPARTKGLTSAGMTTLRMQFAGAASNPRITGENLLPGVSHYLRGVDRSHWRRNVPRYGRVRSHRVYPGIDVVFHGRTGELEYDFEVQPGADPQAIRMTFAGAGNLGLTSEGNLVTELGGDSITLKAPTVYQQTAEGRKLVNGGYRLLAEGKVGFILEAYDPTETLFIDPILSYSTVFGGASIDEAVSVALDPDGYIYVAGTTSSKDFPVAGPLQSALNKGLSSSRDAFVAKLTPDGTSLVYSTFLGGAKTEQVYDLAIDSAKNAYVVG